MESKLYNVLYQGRKIYTNITMEECTEILQSIADNFYGGDPINPELIELEEI